MYVCPIRNSNLPVVYALFMHTNMCNNFELGI